MIPEGAVAISLALFLALALIIYRRRIMGSISSRFASNPLPPIFSEKDEAVRAVRSSPFFDRMTSHDLSARGISFTPTSMREYRKLYERSISSFSAEERLRLRALVSQADELLRPFHFMGSIPWKIAKLGGFRENGWPHTLGDIIFLSEMVMLIDDKSLLEVLLHEKVHVYQRLFPEETAKFVAITPYRAHGPRSAYPMAANNPDIDDQVYRYEGVVVYAGYAEASPQRMDTRLFRDGLEISPDALGLGHDLKQVDHPFEVMASYIAKTLTGEISPPLNDIRHWMTDYM